jgi:uncharacterized protein (TIGR03083 family)
MSHIRPSGPIDTRALFAPLHQELLMMLRTLAPEDWLRPTRAPQWRVGDVVAHLTDSAIRRLSIERDGHAPVAPDGPIGSNAALTAFLDRLNAEWVAASRRISPRLSIELLDIVGRQLAELFEGADLQGTATFPVAWAGDAKSAIWFDIGREYTERWHHHQQVAEAVGAPLLTARRWLYPVLDVSMRALPFAYRDVEAPATTGVTIEITGEAGAQWTLVREPAGWRLFTGALEHAAAHIRVDQDTAWRMFFKQRSREEVLASAHISGRSDLAQPFAGVLAVMA